MTYKIIDIQGIGPVYAEKLIAAGIETVDQLLEKGASAKGRAALEEATGIDHGRILTWVNHADLFRSRSRPQLVSGCRCPPHKQALQG